MLPACASLLLLLLLVVPSAPFCPPASAPPALERLPSFASTALRGPSARRGPEALRGPSARRGPSALAAKRGKGGLGSAGGSKPPNPGFSAPKPPSSSSKFFKTPALATSLPAEDGAVALLETMAPSLINAGTNPNGAIAVARFAGKLFAFQSGCETCQFPFKKAKLLPAAEDSGGDPRLACDFCGCTYNLRTGAPLKDAGVSGNVMGKMVRSTNTKGRSGVRVFELAEDDKGRVLLKL